MVQPDRTQPDGTLPERTQSERRQATGTRPGGTQPVRTHGNMKRLVKRHAAGRPLGADAVSALELISVRFASRVLRAATVMAAREASADASPPKVKRKHVCSALAYLRGNLEPPPPLGCASSLKDSDREPMHAALLERR